MSDSSPVLPNNKMTKSYLLESDPFLKTSSKTSSPFALNAAPEEASPGGGAPGPAAQHVGSWNSERAAAAAAAAASIQQQLYRQHLRLQEHSIPGQDLFADRPSAKPLAGMHHVAANVPPIAYINGNSVRPFRCRHYSQQQTALSVMQQQQLQHNNALSISNSASGNSIGGNRNNRNSGNDSMSDSMESTSSASSSSSNSSISENEEMMEHDGQNGSAGPVLFSAGNVSAGQHQRKVQFADSQMNTSSSSASQTSSSSTTNQQQSSVNPQAERSSSPQSRRSSSWFSLWSSPTSSTSAPSSSSSASSSQRDYVTNNENESLSIFSHYSDPDMVTGHLAKVIEDQLREAREKRRMVCNELYIPKVLTKQIATKISRLAESEPCGLRGCFLYICIEETNNSASTNSGTAPVGTAFSGDQQQHSNSQLSSSAVSSRLLAEVSLDPSMVPTFEVFLTLKRILPSWFEALENKLLGKDRIVLSENYLLHKKKLYQNSTPTSSM